MNALFDTTLLQVEKPLRRGQLPDRVLHQMGCKVCPLARLANENPDMPASGSDDPLVYILGEAPGKNEDVRGIQFIGKSGNLLHQYIPHRYHNRLRYNNVVRTRPHKDGKNATPDRTAIECCRPSVVRDIEETKPKAILGFGNIPLQWVSDYSGISMWRGRRMPVKIGSHVCWYYPLHHPAYLLRLRKKTKSGDEMPSIEEDAFVWDIKRAFAELRHLPKPEVHTPQQVFAGIELVTDNLDKVEECFRWAAQQTDVGFDYETDGLRPYDSKHGILSFAICTGDKGYAIALDHPESTWGENAKRHIVSLLMSFLRSKVRKWVHNLAFELEWSGVEFGRSIVRTPNWEDTQTQASIIDERRGKTKPGPFALEFLVQQYFGFNLKKLSNLDRKRLARYPLHKVLMYNGGDARYHVLLGLKQKRIIAEHGLQFPYKLKLRRVATLVLSQMKGVPVNQEVNHQLRVKYAKRIKLVERKIAKLPIVSEFQKLKKEPYNPLSGPHALFVFRDMLERKECKVETHKKAEGYKWSVEEDVLAKIKHPLARLTLQLRKATKRKSTYLDPYCAHKPGTMVYKDKLLHCSFNSWPETGRLSCEDPNLQNVPKRDDEAKEVRAQIAALQSRKRKRIVLACDHGQIEARVIGAASMDKAFVKSLWEDYDVHMEWAERLAYAYPRVVGGRKFLKDKAVLKKWRGDIKNSWTFPLFFGATLFKASSETGIPEDILKPEYERFWRTFTGVAQWQEDVKKFYKKNGYVETMNGARRRAPLSVNQIINSPIQGTAAEIIMHGMSELSEIGDWDLQPELQIHDDLTWVSMPVDRVDELAPIIIDKMLDLPWKWAERVPWSIEMSIGDNWLEMEELGTFFSHHWFKEPVPKWVAKL